MRTLSCILTVVGAVSPALALAQDAPPSNVFVQALGDPRSGEAIASLPASPQADPVVRALQQQTGDNGPIVVKAWRVARFEQQARCGRIAFELAQPSSGKTWPTIGGQLNLCADGLPPLQVCRDDKTTLVPAGTKCRDGSAARDTPEVAEAIRAALANGGLSSEQARASLVDHRATQVKPGATPPLSATPTKGVTP